ncbi:hypothetical protein BY458DRAFT_7429 [Sporodiniella umbellata]|nr:hypothetical protein BY458DRAFT_7429 [Sporodiniella umbellata]
MSRNSMEDRNAIMTSTTTTTRYASDLPSFHPPNYSEWPIQKMSPPSFLMQTHPYPSTSFPGYPTYPTAPPHTAATVSTPSYCSTFSEASHSSPTLFWAHPNPPETDHTHLLTEVATPTTTATTTTTTTQPNNNSQEISPEPSNKVSLTSELFSPIITRDLPNPYSPVISQKVHPRYKTTNTCTLAYDQRSRQKHSQHFLSPPLHPIDSSSQLLTAPSPDLCKSKQKKKKKKKKRGVKKKSAQKKKDKLYKFTYLKG